MADLASRITEPKAAGETPAPAPTADAAEAPAAATTESNGDADATPAGGPGLWDSEEAVQVSLTDLQSDESTPFYSATTFEDLKL